MGTHSLDEILAPKDKGQMSQHVPHFSSSSSFSSVTIVDSNGVSIITIKKAIKVFPKGMLMEKLGNDVVCLANGVIG